MGFASRCAPAAFVLLLAEAAYARTAVLKTQAGSVVHWTQREITVAVDASANSQKLHHLAVLQAVERATVAWNRIPADQPRLRMRAGGRSDVTVRFCRGEWQGDTIDLGRTQFAANPRDGSVSAATVELNECDHKLAPPGETGADGLDLQSVMTHELGHVLGLGHADTPSAVMFPNGRGAVTRAPSADDETALAIIYLGREPPAAAARAPGGAPEHALAPAGNPRAPGPSVAASAAERRGPSGRPPPDSVSTLSLKGSGGREVTIYTCEPTLLPAIAESRPEKAGRRAKPGHPTHGGISR